MRNYSELLNRKRREYGEKFDPSDLAEQFRPYFGTGQRIKVNFGHEVVTGTVGVTTGWKPGFLLMRRIDSIGSSYLLSKSDKIEAVKVGNKYINTNGGTK